MFKKGSEVKITQLCSTLCNCMEFSGPEHWTGLPFPSPGDLPKTGIEPRSPALQADSLPAEPQGKPYVSANADLWGVGCMCLG